MTIGRRALLKMPGVLIAQVLLSACAPTPARTRTPSPPPPVPTILLRPPTAPAAPAGVPTAGPAPEARVLATLRPEHPRLLVLPDDLHRIGQAIAADGHARGYRDALFGQGERLLAEEPAERVLIGSRLLRTSQRVLERVYVLALLHRLDGDPRWAERAAGELLAVAAFADWNPAHFLDVAELAHAFAIGYDWLHGVLTPQERATIKAALLEKGLRPAEQAYRDQASWVAVGHNWNAVCNGGVILGALAVADEEPVLAQYLLSRAVASLPAALASYAPDGAWVEGSDYWGYATGYAALAFAALQSALGTDFGLSARPGLAQTGAFRLRSAGPTGLVFNFADAQERPGVEPALFWLARRYDDPVLAQGGRDAAGAWGSPRDLIWYDPRGTPEDRVQLGLDSQYRRIGVALFRSAWNDPRALFVGFKGGDNGADHVHLDAGTFVLDARGQRWAIDLGPDDHELPGYFGRERWSYYRTRTEGHNTLILDGRNQSPTAVAPLTLFASSPAGGYAVADLTAVYAPSGATKLRRGVALLNGRERVLVQDEIEASKPVEVVWAMHTRAQITGGADADRAELVQGGERLSARILAPAGARFDVAPVEIAAPQRPAPDVQKLIVRLPGRVASTRLAVLLAPGEEADPPGIVPLDRWATAGSDR